MKRSAKITIMSILWVCLLAVAAGNAFSEEYSPLKGLKSIKAVFNFEQGNPQSALIHLKLIHQTYKDENIRKVTKKPDFVVIFLGPAVKLVSKNRGGFTAGDQKILDEFARTVSAMAKDGIKLEICLFAVKVFGVESSTIQSEIKQVGNGWISLIGYEAKGYSLVPIG
jgi:intracellular sulfur oxidation DsrE/DsrF family protein